MMVSRDNCLINLICFTYRDPHSREVIQMTTVTVLSHVYFSELSTDLLQYICKNELTSYSNIHVSVSSSVTYV